MKKIFLIFLMLLTAIPLWAGDPARKGTTGAEELLIPVGAKGIATGGAMLATLTGLESIYYNPAGLDLSNQTEAMFSYMNYIADINVSYFAASASLGELGSVGLSFKTFDFGDIPITTNDFPDGTGSTYSPSFLIVGLTYSKIITDRVSIGTNLKLISESIQDTKATGVAVDFGVQYRFNSQFYLGASLKNIGSNLVYSGPELQSSTTIQGTDAGTSGGIYEVVAEEFQIPSYFELSLGYNYNFNDQNNILLGSTFTANNSLEDKMNFGMEYGFLKTLFLRAGYNMLIGASADQSIFGFTAGAGIDYLVGNGLGVTFDYAFRDVKDFPTANHIFTVKLSLK